MTGRYYMTKGQVEAFFWIGFVTGLVFGIGMGVLSALWWVS